MKNSKWPLGTYRELKKHIKKIIHDYAMLFEIIISKFIKISAMVEGCDT